MPSSGVHQHSSSAHSDFSLKRNGQHNIILSYDGLYSLNFVGEDQQQDLPALPGSAIKTLKVIIKAPVTKIFILALGLRMVTKFERL